MTKTQRKNNMGKAHNKSTPNSTNPTEGPYKEFSKERSQDTNLRRTILDIVKENRELREENEKLKKDLEGDNDTQWKELRGEIEKLKKDLEGENDKLQKEVKTLKRYQTKMKKENDQQTKELQDENERLQREVQNLKKSKDEMKKDIEHSYNHQERMGKSLRSRMEEAEKRISDLQDNTKQLESSSKDYEKLKKMSGTTRKCGTL